MNAKTTCLDYLPTSFIAILCINCMPVNLYNLSIFSFNKNALMKMRQDFLSVMSFDRGQGWFTNASMCLDERRTYACLSVHSVCKKEWWYYTLIFPWTYLPSWSTHFLVELETCPRFGPCFHMRALFPILRLKFFRSTLININQKRSYWCVAYFLKNE